MIWQPDDRTIVVSSRARIEKFIDGRFSFRGYNKSAGWSKLKSSDAVIFMHGRLARRQIESSRTQPGTAGFGIASLIPYVQTIADEAEFLELG